MNPGVYSLGFGSIGVAEQHLLQVAEAVGVAVHLAQQDIAADLDLLQNAVEGGDLRAAVLQIDKNGKFTRRQKILSDNSEFGMRNAEFGL